MYDYGWILPEAENDTIQKQMAVTTDNGVTNSFSFLLFDSKFMTEFRDKYAAKKKHIPLVIFIENQSGITAPVCRITMIAIT